MNLDKEKEYVDKLLAERGSIRGEAKLLGHILEILIKVQANGIRRTKKPKLVFEKYREFVAIYATFIRERQGVGILLDAPQGAALKRIITYLVANSKEKTEQGALDAWQYVLANWKEIAPFLQQQVSLIRIYANLTEILDNLRNGHYKKNKGHHGLADLKSQL